MKIKVNINKIISIELNGITNINDDEYHQQSYLNNDSYFGKIEVVKSIPTVNTPESLNDFNFIIDVNFENDKLQQALELLIKQ